LKLQQEVHEDYLNKVRCRGLPSVGQSLVPPNGQPGNHGRTPTAAPPDAEEPAAGGVMIGEILSYQPGHSLVMRRQVDLDQDLYARDHTFGGRDASAVDRDYHGLAVMPMALNLEMMAEVASLLVPGKLVVGLRRVRLQRWIPLFDEPITMEVTAEVLPKAAGSPEKAATWEVAMEVRDLGNATYPGNTQTPVVQGTVVLGEEYPDPPPAEPFKLTNQRPCPIGPDELYHTERRLFHGPSFQAVSAVGRMGDEGVEGELVTLSHAGLFGSTDRPDLLLDPLLIDASTHVLGSWHLAQPDRSGRVVFPYELGNVQLFGPRPPEGTRLTCQVAIEQASARQVRHRIDMIGPDGKLWCRLYPAEYWRFYWPPECVDFFRLHDRFLVTHDWPEVAPPVAESEASPPGVSVRRIDSGAAPDIVQPVIRGALARVSLSPAEWQRFYTMQGPDRRRTQWLFGRIAAKDCIRTLWLNKHGRRLFPADVEIETDEHGRPQGRKRFADDDELPRISIAHSEGIIVALAAWQPRVGIDLERITERGEGFEQIAFDPQERELLDRFGLRRDEGIARFWCAKEAVAKALGRGLIEGPRSLAVRQIRAGGEVLELELGSRLKSLFPEFASSLLVAWTNRRDDFVVATTFAEKGPNG